VSSINGTTQDIDYFLYRFTGARWVTQRAGRDKYLAHAVSSFLTKDEATEFVTTVYTYVRTVNPALRLAIIVDIAGGVGQPRYGVDESGCPIVGRIGTPPGKYQRIA